MFKIAQPGFRSPITSLLLLGIFVIGVDQLTKWMATQSLRHSPPQFYLSEMLCLKFALNPGGFLSLGGGLSESVRQWLFIGANGVLLLGILAFMVLKAKRLSHPTLVCLGLVLAGGIGNMIDRVSNHGLVTDFIVMRIGPLQTGVFNIADIAITGGSIGIAVLVFFSDLNWKQTTAASELAVVQDQPE